MCVINSLRRPHTERIVLQKVMSFEGYCITEAIQVARSAEEKLHTCIPCNRPSLKPQTTAKKGRKAFKKVDERLTLSVPAKSKFMHAILSLL